VITAAIDAVQPSADTKAIQLESVLEPRIARFGDPERLQQVVESTFKCHQVHSCWRRVEVRLEYVDSQVQIAVSDTGGISADFLPYVFDRFRQADTSTRVHKARTGAGDRVT